MMRFEIISENGFSRESVENVVRFSLFKSLANNTS